MIRKILITILAASVSLMLHAQRVTGRVIDENDSPMEFVNVVLLNQADSAFITGAVTRGDGAFIIDSPAVSSAYIVRLSSVGYTTLFFKLPPSGDIGTVAMSPSGLMLGEVVVKSDLPVTSIRGNALVTKVENSVLAHAGTADDVLRQVPMVLGRDGNFEVFGHGKPLIYVNGRKVQDMAELSQLGSADIKDVEVITTPGAKYDASARSVIRIRMKPPKGDGWSGTLRAQNGLRHCFVSTEQANLKYRTGGLELFGNFGYLGGRFREYKTNDILTRSSVVWDQIVTTKGYARKNEAYGKIGFSYMFDDRHSIGAYYSGSLSAEREEVRYGSDITADGLPYDHIVSSSDNRTDGYPVHHTNLYYNGSVGRLGIDFNMDYMWKKSRERMSTGELSDNFDNTDIYSYSSVRSRMLAEKLVLSYPLWRGQIEAGNEYTSSRMSNLYRTDAAQVGDADSRVDESNMAGFIQLMQGFGTVNVSVGLRYEHVKYEYLEGGVKMADRDRTYDNLFPSLSLSAMLGKVQLSLSYASKVYRPTYASLDGTVDYINRFTLESGNPYLQPTKIHSLELMGAWNRFFGQVSYNYKKNPILNTSIPYDEDGEIKLVTKYNHPEIKELQAFVGGQFQVGAWQPKVNLGIIRQWVGIDHADGRKRFDNPLAFVQFQNAVHLPCDIWLNIDMQWMSEGDNENMHLDGSASYINAKLYKAFAGNRFSVTLEANDIFNKDKRSIFMYSRDVTIHQVNLNDNRSFLLTLQYNFNTTRDRYKGSGAGNEERSRL